MLFNSPEYILFYSLFFAIFFLLKDIGAQILLICAGSLYFYASWSPEHAILLMLVCLLAYSVQLKLLSTASPHFQVIVLLGILFIFKYYNFFVGIAESFDVTFTLSHLVLPVGISFYIFQAISYVVDHRRQHIPDVNFMSTVAYISFFPQLVAGPIVRASVFLPQLARKREYSRYMLHTGLLLFSMGMFKKVVIADNVGMFVDQVYSSPGATTAGNHWLAFYLYAIQIYYDFCGYSEMAIGIARTLGFKFPRNFARPYLSASITEFWGRWHISLSSWLRDYLYIPLGGNRKGRLRTYINLLLVMLLGGLWHGAAWTFVLWGGLHGLALAIERLIKLSWGNKYLRLPGIVITFHIVCISWVFFRSPDFTSAIQFFYGLADVQSLGIVTSKFLAIKCVLLILFFVVIEYYSNIRIFLTLRRPVILVPALLLYGVLFLLLGNFSESPFIYFQF